MDLRQSRRRGFGELRLPGKRHSRGGRRRKEGCKKQTKKVPQHGPHRGRDHTLNPPREPVKFFRQHGATTLREEGIVSRGSAAIGTGRPGCAGRSPSDQDQAYIVAACVDLAAFSMSAATALGCDT